MLYDWAVGMGFRESVMTLDELLDGNDVTGSELEGLPRDVMIQALKVLESQGKARYAVSCGWIPIRFMSIVGKYLVRDH